MADRIDHLTERVQVVENKVDQLEKKVDEGFNAVDAAFLEQRQYIEFCCARLETKLGTKMDAGFGRVERKLDQFMDVMDRRLGALEAQGRQPDTT